MHPIITNLQQKTDQEKAALAVVLAVVVTSLLFLGWGYNFAHGGKIDNLASSAVAAVGVVESANLSENFNSALEQLKDLGVLSDEGEPDNNGVIKAGDTTETRGAVGMRHMNVFTGVETSQQYGENVGDVLY